MADLIAANFYAGSGLDRASHLRGDRDWVEARLAAPSSRFVPVWRMRNLVAADPGGRELPEPVFLDAAAASRLVQPDAPIVLLGLDSDVAYFAIDLSHIEGPDTGPAVVPNALFTDLRSVGPMMGRNYGALLAYARAMLTWHRAPPLLQRLRRATDSAEAGHSWQCTQSRLQDACFPAHRSRGHHAGGRRRRVVARPPGDPGRAGMFSTLAGFVEPGESIEDAVAREVFEEVGLRIADIHYHSSQPWPFPSTHAGVQRARREFDITLDSDELEDGARWFTRAGSRNAGGRQLPAAAQQFDRAPAAQRMDRRGALALTACTSDVRASRRRLCRLLSMRKP